MKYLDRMKFGKKGTADSALDAEMDQEVAPETGRNDAAVGEAGAFDDFDGKRKLVEEWWLQSDIEDVVEEEPEEEEEAGGEEEKEEEGDKDDLLYSLTSEMAADDDEENKVLKEAMEAMGEISADELLDLGRTVLQGIAVEVDGKNND